MRHGKRRQGDDGQQADGRQVAARGGFHSDRRHGHAVLRHGVGGGSSRGRECYVARALLVIMCVTCGQDISRTTKPEPEHLTQAADAWRVRVKSSEASGLKERNCEGLEEVDTTFMLNLTKLRL